MPFIPRALERLCGRSTRRRVGYKYNLSFGAGFIRLAIGSRAELSVRSSELLDCLKVWGFLGQLSASQLMLSSL
jgi:hypothetical protein